MDSLLFVCQVHREAIGPESLPHTNEKQSTAPAETSLPWPCESVAVTSYQSPLKLQVTSYQIRDITN